MEELVKYLRGLLLLGVSQAQEEAARTGRAQPRLELLLADAGFAHREIAAMLNKSQVAVAKAVSRGRAGRRLTENGPSERADEGVINE
jgi:DNA-directed RNA polymerase specialized sigma24 family protein